MLWAALPALRQRYAQKRMFPHAFEDHGRHLAAGIPQFLEAAMMATLTDNRQGGPIPDDLVPQGPQPMEDLPCDKPLVPTEIPEFLRGIARKLERLSNQPDQPAELLRIADAYAYADYAMQHYALRRDGARAIIALVSMNVLEGKRPRHYLLQGYSPPGQIHQLEYMQSLVNRLEVENMALRQRLETG